jgi:hypothetical protein
LVTFKKEHSMATDTNESATVSSDPGRSNAQAADTKQSAGIPHVIREQAIATWSHTKEKARSTLNDQQQAAAAGIGDLADALHTAAGDLGSKDKKTVSDLAEEAANGLERLSQTLRGKELGTMVHEAEAFARREPALFLGAAVAAGFLAVRFLKSSSEPPRMPRATERTPERVEIAPASDDVA